MRLLSRNWSQLLRLLSLSLPFYHGSLTQRSQVAGHKERFEMWRRGWCCSELNTFSSGRPGHSLLIAGLKVKDSGRVSFADGSLVTAADRKVQGWNSLL